MRLIGLAVVLALGLVIAPVAAEAEQAGKVPRVGYLNPGSASDPLRQRRLDAFREGLRALGYVEGQNIAVEHRWAEGKYERYPTLAADLVRSKVDVIVAQSGEATKAVQAATRTIPIVMSMVMDPVGSGIVPSLARPGANVTGTSFMAPDLVGKQWRALDFPGRVFRNSARTDRRARGEEPPSRDTWGTGLRGGWRVHGL